MVKKTGILGKLRNRWKSASGVEVDRRSRGRGAAESESDAPSQVPAALRSERVSGRKMSSKEEAVIAMGEGFRELSSMMRGVHTRLEGQGADVGKLPALGQAQLDLLKQMAAQLEQQNTTNGKLAHTLSSLPEMLTGVELALKRAAAADERTASTLGEFRETMDRIQGSMGKMVDSAKEQTTAAEKLTKTNQESQERLAEKVRQGRHEDVEKLADAVAKGREQDVQRLQQATGQSLELVRRVQNEQSALLGKLAADSAKWGNVVVILLTLTFFALAAVLAVMLATN